jgi:hypothetical protein
VLGRGWVVGNAMLESKKVAGIASPVQALSVRGHGKGW